MRRSDQRSRAFTRKVAIWPRVTKALGLKHPPDPLAIPAAATARISRSNGWPAVSQNDGPPAFRSRRSARAMNAAIWPLVTESPGRKLPFASPVAIPAPATARMAGSWVVPLASGNVGPSFGVSSYPRCRNVAIWPRDTGWSGR
jgi:hypothetical protein